MCNFFFITTKLMVRKGDHSKYVSIFDVVFSSFVLRNSALKSTKKKTLAVIFQKAEDNLIFFLCYLSYEEEKKKAGF